MAFKKITKFDLVEAVYLNSKYEKSQVQEIFESFLDQIKSSLEKGSTIELRGFGTFETRLRKGRSKARNPKTGTSLSVAPHYTAVFRPGQDLKKSLMELPVTEKE